MSNFDRIIGIVLIYLTRTHNAHLYRTAYRDHAPWGVS